MEAIGQDLKNLEKTFVDVYVSGADLDIRAHAPAQFCRALTNELRRWGVETNEHYCSPCG